MYQQLTLIGRDDLPITFHMCQVDGVDMLEVWMPGVSIPVILTREQFEQFAGWIHREFDDLSKFKRIAQIEASKAGFVH